MKYITRLAIVIASFLLFITTSTTPLKAQKQNKKAFFKDLKFRNVGPTRGGRATAVAGIHAEPGTFYMGATGGGVWKTEDYGINWTNVSDGFFASPSIGAIRVYQNNPDIVYVGTGSDGIRSNVIVGKGVYKSKDAGKSWKHIGLKKAGLIGAVEIHPENPDVVFVAAIGQPFQPNKERGVYKTTDGGQSWEQVLFIADTVGVADIEFAPDNPDIVYAAAWRTERKPWTIISGGENGGIYKSTDGGNSWTKKENGLPTGIIGKIDFAVSKADPKRLYALIEAIDGEGGVFRSDDYGENFVRVNDDMRLLNRPFYYCNIDANPVNADALFVNTGSYYHSSDAGVSWSRRSTPHGDNHDIWINENDTNIYIQANDGGVNVTLNDGKSWSTQYNQPTAELYTVDVDDQNPYWLYSGQQDNSTITVPSLPPYGAPGGPTAYWMAVGGCETGPAVPKPGNHNVVYANCKGHFGVYNKITGQERSYTANPSNIYGHNPKDLEFRFQRVAPIAVSPHNPDVVYHGSQYVHKTSDDGYSWEIISPDLTAFEPDKQVNSGSPITRDITGEEYYSVLYSIRESPVAQGLIWTGANDGPVHVTRDGGKTWKNVTPADLPPGGRVDCIEPSPHQAAKAYVAVLRYQLGDWHPYIYKTNNYGESWTLLTTGNNGLPADFPTRVVREDPDKEGLLYAGTEFGLFISFDDGKNWKSFQQNLPVTPVTDIRVYRKDLVLSTMGRSFWIMDNISQLHHQDEIAAADKNLLIKPRDSYRLRYRQTRANSVPSYPVSAVTIDYFMAAEPEGEISLNILDADQNIIQSYVSKAEKNKQAEGSENMAMSYYFQPSREVNLSKAAGMHRIEWDMRHKGAWNANPRRSYRNGPYVAPGKYYVSLEVDGQEMKQEFMVYADSRLDEIGVGTKELKEQETFALKLVELTSEANKLTDKIVKRRKEIAELQAKKAKSKLKKEDAKLKVLEDKLNMKAGIYQQPQLNDQISFLSRSVTGADQQPAKNTYLQYEKLKNQLATIKAEFENL